jgi:hypothetical protein
MAHRGSIRRRVWKAPTVVAVLATLCAFPCSAAVDISLQASPDPVQVGRVVDAEIVLSNTGPTTASVAAVDVLLAWDPSEFRLTGFSGPAGNPWIALGFLNDPDGINNTFEDGNGLLTALAFPGNPIDIPPSGQFTVATVEFLALRATPAASIDILDSLGAYGQTRVFAPEPPQTDILGDTFGAAVEIFCTECVGDLDGDFDTDLDDLTLLLRDFGTTGSPGFLLGDFDCDGVIDLDDLTLLLQVFGTSCL